MAHREPKKAYDITINMRTTDGERKHRRFKSLEGARKFAMRYVGKTPEISEMMGYAVSPYGDAKITASGISLEELFAEEKPVPTECDCHCNEDTGQCWTCDYCMLPSTIAAEKARREREHKEWLERGQAENDRLRALDGDDYIPF